MRGTTSRPLSRGRSFCSALCPAGEILLSFDPLTLFLPSIHSRLVTNTQTNNYAHVCIVCVCVCVCTYVYIYIKKEIRKDLKKV